MAERIALVTGASRGLGFATALALAGPGTHVIALARTTGGLEELDDAIREKGGTATLVPMSLTDDAGLARLGLSVYERWGRLDLLVHCAAQAAPLSPVGHVDEKDFDGAMALNARATLRLIAIAEPLLKAAGPGATAVFCDDRSAGKFHAAYAASKAAARAVVDAWAAETAAIGPRVVTFTPEPMPTALRGRFRPGENREALASADSQAEALLAALKG
ncbi:SDR family oxidoreductase [Paroceanicella profunda]|uniref:SDR family oxidoreductase n=1 Tax=Paroceanicella profunda TaxID=2579971 RepID=A0A5B8FHU7_9RHOB|nr:SDR family oxidoreductase [Paroceanicella profunda]QDL92378.1 SDR family oxidoreductase [Paroceanicella profunda]